MVRHRKSHSHKAHRKTHRKAYKKSRKQQRGGGWGFTGPAFAPAGGMAPEAARALTDDCATTARPAPSVTQTGAWSQAGGGCGCAAVLAPTPQQGGGMFDWLLGKKEENKQQASDLPEIPVSEAAMTPENPIPMNENPVEEAQSGGRRRYRKRRQHGGGGGGGGYGFTLDNSLGKVYAATPVGPCPQKGGNAEALVSYPAGYGYAPASAMEVGNGSAHFLAQIPYGKQCMGGGARRATRRKGARRATGRKGARKSHRKSRRHH